MDQPTPLTVRTALTALLSLALALALAAALPTAAQAAGTGGIDGPFTYDWDEAGATITGYDATAGTDVAVPATIATPDGPRDVTAIGEEAFMVKGLTSVTLPTTVTRIDEWALAGNQLTSISLPPGLDRLSRGVLSWNQLTSIVVPDGVTTIEASALSVNSLTSLTLPDSVASIGAAAFSGNALTTFTLPPLVTEIPESMLSSNELTEFTIPARVTSVGDDALSLNALESVTAPATVTSWGSYVFQGNPLTEATVPMTWTTIPTGMFSGTSLTEFTFPTALRSIEAEAFDNSELLSIDIPEGVTWIGGSAFADVPAWTVSLPSTLEGIGGHAFKLNFRLTEIELPESLTSIGPAAFAFTGLTSVSVPAGVTTLSHTVFGQSFNLSAVELHEGLEVIEYGAFGGTALTDIAIPSTVTAIGEAAFTTSSHPDVTSKISTVVFEGAAPSMGNNAFGYSDDPLVTYRWAHRAGFDTPTWTVGDDVYRTQVLTTTTFDAAGGVPEPAPVDLLAGEQVPPPSTPSRDHYLFDGWFDSPGAVAPWDFATPVTTDLTLTAGWTGEPTSVTWDPHDGGATTVDTVPFGSTLQAPTAPTRDGYTFQGWFTAADGGDPWDFDAGTVAGPLTLHGQWTRDVHTLTWDPANGDAPALTEVLHGDLATAIASPTRPGYMFVGWSADGTDLWDAAAERIVAPLTLTAQWEANTPTVTGPSQALPGDTISVTVAGLSPHETFSLELHSTPLTLGTGVADETGSYTGSFLVPASVTPGTHELVIVGEHSGTGVVGLAVLPTSAELAADGQDETPTSGAGGQGQSRALAATGSEPQPRLAAALLLTLVGAALVLAVRRRATR